MRVRILCALAVLAAPARPAEQTVIRIEASHRLHAITPRFIAVNMEDLNFQGYGGIYSQVLFGESFQEHVDSACLGLSGKKRLMVFVGENASGDIELWGFRGRGWQHDAAREALEVPARGDNTPVAMAELPPDKRRALLASAAGDRQVSRHWRAFESGSARGVFRFERRAPFVGKQSQAISHESGTGEVGIDNAGLNRWGIHLVSGKPYEGVLRVRAERGAEVWVSLRDATGTRVLAEKMLPVQADTAYQRIEFTLAPKSSDAAGRFAVSLRRAASVTVGYAFLQPGAWGRYAGLPLRKDLVEALKAMGVKAVRWDGSMVNKCPDGHLYRWKEMIGPRDSRKPFRGFFNPYASHGFAIFDVLNLCEAAGFLPIPGIRVDETPEDMADFVEYVNGPADSKWGSRRAADGHPEPYRLQHLEIGNEERLDESYCERFETLARAIWGKDPAMTLLVAHNLRTAADFAVGPNGETSETLRLAARLARFARERKGSIWWDAHYQARPGVHDNGTHPQLTAMEALHSSIRKLVPGFDLPVAPLEENGATHDLDRALQHARNQNAFARLGDFLPVVAVANGLQAYGQDLVWSQGRIHFTPSQIILQPPYYVDQIVTRTWAPQMVRSSVEPSGGGPDATARLTADGRKLVLYAVNDRGVPVDAALVVDGFQMRSPAARVIELSGAPGSTNSPEAPFAIAPRESNWKHAGKLHYRFPAHSYTAIQFE